VNLPGKKLRFTFFTAHQLCNAVYLCLSVHPFIMLWYNFNERRITIMHF